MFKIQVTEVNLDEDKLTHLVKQGVQAVANDIMADIKEYAVYTVYPGGKNPSGPSMLKSQARDDVKPRLPIWHGTLLNSLEVREGSSLSGVSYDVVATAPYASLLSMERHAPVDDTLTAWYKEKKGRRPPQAVVHVTPTLYMQKAANIQEETDRETRNINTMVHMITRG